MTDKATPTPPPATVDSAPPLRFRFIEFNARRAMRGAAQAVRMLTQEELNDVALSEQVGWEPGEYVEAVQRKFAEVNGRRIPADGKIGAVRWRGFL